MATMMAPPSRRYAAFISYRHQDSASEGRRWAEWLHRSLERYRVPPDLVGTVNQRGEIIRPSLYPIFRDQEELSASPDLVAEIEAALDSSEHLIVVCSPRSRVSPWVKREVREFKELGRGNRILAVIVAGEPNVRAETDADNECFCDELRFGRARSDGTMDWSAPAEPLAADLRPENSLSEGFVSADAYRDHLSHAGANDAEHIAALTEAYRQRLELGLLKIIAGILGVPLGRLADRDAIYRAELARQQLAKAKLEADRLRAANRKLVIAATVVLALAIAASLFWRRAAVEQSLAELHARRARAAQKSAEQASANAIREKNRAELERIRATAAQKVAEEETAKKEKALTAANYAAGDLVSELVVGTRNWQGIDANFRARMLVRAQNALLFALTASNTSNNDIRRNLGIVYSELGMVKMETEEFGLAATSFDAAEDMFTKIRREKPHDRQLLSDLVIVLNRKGQMLIESKKPAEAVVVLSKALRLSPGVENPVTEQSTIHTRLGIAYLRLGQHKNAKYHLDAANRQLESVIDEASSWNDLRRLAASHLNVADILDPATEGAEIEKHIQKVQTLYSTIVSRSPDGSNDTELIEIMISAASISGKLYDKTGRVTEAIAAYRHALETAINLLKSDPTSRRWMRKAADDADELAMYQINNRRREDAVPILKLSLALWRQILERSQNDTEVKLHVAVASLQLARALGGAPEPFAESQRLLHELVIAGVISRDLEEGLIDQYKSEFKIP